MDSNYDQSDDCETIGLSLGLTTNLNIKKEKPTTTRSMSFDLVSPCLSLGPTDDHRSPSYSNNDKSEDCLKRSISNQDKDSIDCNHEDEEEEGSPRKKLRLTKDQSSVLEDAFKEHSTLNPSQKQELAKQLNLRPRQVEVWFQNRRARTKLKQTEMDCEVLKKHCEKLMEENKRLKEEVDELNKSLQLHSYSGCFAHHHHVPIL